MSSEGSNKGVGHILTCRYEGIQSICRTVAICVC